MNVVEWLLVCELVLLLSAGFFWGVSHLIAGKDPDDPLTVFWRTFWKVFLRRRVKVKVALASLEHNKAREYEAMKQHGDVEGIKELLREELDEHEVDDAELSKLLEADAEQRAALSASMTGVPPGGEQWQARKAVLDIKVIPFSERDELVKIDNDGAVIQVVNGSEDGRSNKAVIDILAIALHIKPYQISLLKGHYRSRKLVQIAGLDQSQLTAKMSSFS